MVIGAIVPRLVASGTVTRRAVEPTWLTASNAYVRIIYIVFVDMTYCERHFWCQHFHCP